MIAIMLGSKSKSEHDLPADEPCRKLSVQSTSSAKRKLYQRSGATTLWFHHLEFKISKNPTGRELAKGSPQTKPFRHPRFNNNIPSDVLVGKRAVHQKFGQNVVKGATSIKPSRKASSAGYETPFCKPSIQNSVMRTSVNSAEATIRENSER